MDTDDLRHLIHHIASITISTGGFIRSRQTIRYAPDANSLSQIAALAEPQWQELFRRLNGAENGTVRLVRLRERLLAMSGEDSAVTRIETGLATLAYLVQPRLSGVAADRLVNTSQYSEDHRL